MQIKGQNYLVPIDANMTAEYEVPDETLAMDTVVRALAETKSKLNIFVLDCCRDDPFARSWRGTRSAGGGGLVMPADMPQGMFIAYATSPNKTAEDGDGKNSPYAAALVEELGQPGIDFEGVFKNVGAKVVKSTGGKQEPWSNSKFYGKFSFVVSATGGGTDAAPGSAPVAETAASGDPYAAAKAPPEKWLAMAQTGDALAQALLARAYQYGTDGQPMSRRDAAAWAGKSAAQNHPLGVFMLGVCIEGDLTRPKETREREARTRYSQAVEAGFETMAENGGRQWMERLGTAYFTRQVSTTDMLAFSEWLRKAAELNDPLAMYTVGAILMKKDEKSGVVWLRKSAELRCSMAMLRLGLCFRDASGVEKDEVEAVKWYREAAELNYPEAQFQLGYAYERGSGVPQDDKSAVEWYRKAAESNLPGAMFLIGNNYARGKGVTKDVVTAMEWYRKAADMDNEGAMFFLGLNYENGVGVAKDAKTAVKWYQKAAGNGHILAMNQLAECYENGTGVTKDLETATKWYRAAADAGGTGAMNALGIRYMAGSGVTADTKAGVQWFNKAADAGNSAAMSNLANCYAEGRGVTKSKTKAAEWRKKAETAKSQGN